MAQNEFLRRFVDEFGDGCGAHHTRALEDL